MDAALGLYGLGAVVSAWSLRRLKTRLELSRAKHPSLRGHARMAARIARLVPFYEYDEARFFGRTARRPTSPCARRDGFGRLAEAPGASAGPRRSASRRRSRTASPTCSSPPPTACRSSSAATSDGTCRPAPSCDRPRGHGHRSRRQQLLRPHRLVRRERLRLRLLQGLHRARGCERVGTWGRCSGAYHPVVADNVRRLRAISGLDEVSFHMSGTEAVMQAVRLARYHTRRLAPGAILRRVPRLVGRRAAGRRQPARPRATPTP